MGTFSCQLRGEAASRFGLAVAVAIVNLCAAQARAQSCVPAPAGLVGLWKGENSVNDSVTGTQGMLVNNATFAEGLVGQAFRFDGYRSVVVLDDSSAYHLQDFTIEAWIRRENASKTSGGAHGGEI